MCWLCSELEVQKHINHATQLGQELSSGLFDITLEIPFPDAGVDRPGRPPGLRNPRGPSAPLAPSPTTTLTNPLPSGGGSVGRGALNPLLRAFTHRRPRLVCLFFPGKHFSETQHPHTDTPKHTTRSKRQHDRNVGISQQSSPEEGGPLRSRQGLRAHTLTIDLHDRVREEEGGRRTCGARASG